MRMMMQVTIPTESGNEAFKNGSFVQAIQDVLENAKPEAVYFTTMNGCRGGIIVFDLQDVTQIPKLAEPLFLALGATVELTPAFTPQELEQTASDIHQAVQKYGKA